jgi:hypothetical protein
VGSGRRGQVRRGALRNGLEGCGSHGGERLVWAWKGQARQARLGTVRRGKASFGWAGKVRMGWELYGGVGTGPAGNEEVIR